MNRNFKAQFVSAIVLLGFAFSAHAAKVERDGLDIPACTKVTTACMNAQVTAKATRDVHSKYKTGDTVNGYQVGAHGYTNPKHGLWADCVNKIASGAQVEGVTGISAKEASDCMQAEKTAHPPKAKQ